MVEQKGLEARIEHLEKKVAILTRLAEISASLNAQIQLRPLLKHIMDIAVQITECEAASILLWNDANQQLVFAASTTIGYDESDFIGRPVPMDSIAGRIYTNNEMIQVDNTETDDRHYKSVDKSSDFHTRTILGVPMTYKNRVIGVLQALNKTNMPWTEDDRNYLSIIAAQAAVAIESAKLVMELKRTNEELAEVDKLKNDFIAIASHELRTPLGVIMGYASFLQEEESESAKEHASKVLESALKLRKIIEDMVNLRYLKQNQSDLHLEPISVRRLLQAMHAEVNALMDLRDYEFVATPPEVEITIKVDHTRLMMALTNLMHNAISFTEPGGSIMISADQVSKREVHIHIKDTGIGIEPTQVAKIFEEFYQVEDHMTRKHGGLGIGLSIARAIVQAHGGRIWASSDGIGKGATFSVSLPVDSVS